MKKCSKKKGMLPEARKTASESKGIRKKQSGLYRKIVLR